MNTISRILSIIFHPLFLATYLCLFFMYVYPSTLYPLRAEVFPDFLMLIFLVTAICPLLLIMILRVFGYISSVYLPRREERAVPFMFIAGIYLGMTFILFFQFEIHFSDPLMKFFVIVDLIILSSAIATRVYKVSVHSLGIWGVIGIFLGMNKLTDSQILYYAIPIAFLVAGVVMTSRLQLNAHTPREVLIGSLIGIATSFFPFVILYGQRL